MENNKIPSILKHYMPKKSEVINSETYLLFEDLPSKIKECNKEEWILIAKDEQQTTPLHFNEYMVSCFIQPKTDKDLQKFLSNENWEIDINFGIPSKITFNNYTSEKAIEYNNGLRYESENIIFTPFVFQREFYTMRKSYFDIFQEFVLYYNAFWVEENKAFQLYEKDGDLRSLIKYDLQGNNSLVYVQIDYLMDYLSSHKIILARLYDYKRYTMDNLSKIVGDNKFMSKNLNDNNFFFSLYISSENPCTSYTTFSRLLGKDTIISSRNSQQHYTINSTYKEPLYCQFDYGINENGETKSITCNPNILSSFFVDKGTPNFFELVFFQKKVLLEYYHNYVQYRVSEKAVSKLNNWNITYGIIDDDTIAVYLGDLGKQLPYKEQIHWKKYNICKRATMPDYIIERDFNNNPIEPPIELAPISHFEESYYKLREISSKTFGYSLFLELHENDKYNLDCLRIPITEEFNEFDSQIQALAKIVNDSINQKFIKKNITIEKNDKKEGSIQYLEVFLAQKIQCNEIESIITPFKNLQSLRSQSNAHRKGKDFDKLKTNLHLNQYTNRKFFKDLVLQIIKSMKQISNSIEKHSQ